MGFQGQKLTLEGEVTGLIRNLKVQRLIARQEIAIGSLIIPSVYH